MFRLFAYGATLASVTVPVHVTTIGGIAQKFLAPAGAIAVIVAVALVIYGGFLYITSAGDQNKLGKAMKVIQSALIGLGIVMLAFVIVDFFKELIK